MEPAKPSVKSKTRNRRPSEARVDVLKSPDALARDAAALAQSTVTALRSAALEDLVGAEAPSTNLTSELNNIDFKKMIGGPLQAVVDAQIASSMATITFIKEVGFVTDASTGKSELVMVDFSHKRKDVKADGTADEKDIAIKVPLLAMLPIPSLRIEHVTIDFNVKLNSVETSQTSSDLGIKADVSGGWGPVKFKVSASYQRKSSTGVEVKKEYALNVNVKAVQDEMPAGLEKILNMLAA